MQALKKRLPPNTGGMWVQNNALLDGEAEGQAVP